MRLLMIVLVAALLYPPMLAGSRNLTDADLALIERRIFEGVNDARMQNQMNPLALDGSIKQVAATHVADMAARGYFSHDSREGMTPGQRAAASGIAFTTYTENIFRVSNPDQSPSKLAQTIVDGFLANDWHRYYLLKPSITRTGIAVTRSGSGQILVVQDFLEPTLLENENSGTIAATPAATRKESNWKKTWQKPVTIAVGAYILNRLWKKR